MHVSLKSLPLSLFSFFLLLAGATSSLAKTATVGVTYLPSPGLPPPERVVAALESLKISAVRLPDPDPTVVRAFTYSKISLLLSVPNQLINSFATNRSSATLWLYTHVVPFHPRAQISIISVGNDIISTSISYDDLIPAMRNLHLSLIDLGIRTISISTTFSFINIMSGMFPPSAAEFQEPINDIVIRPLLHFLDETNSSFLVSLYPYKVFRLSSEIPIGYAMFEDNPYNFRDDVITGVRYRNLFDMMVDAVIAAMAVSGHENVPLIVTETGWPCSGSASEAEANKFYAEMYLKGLISHLKSGIGTPLRKEGAVETYVYELFDSEAKNGSQAAGQHWGIMYPNMTLKYSIDFSASERIGGGRDTVVEVVLGLLLLVGVLILL